MCPPVVIPEHVVVGGPGGALDALVRAQVEVELGGVRDAHVHGGAGRDVAALAALLLLVRAEEARVVALLHHDEGDPWFVVWLQLQAIMMTIPSSESLIVIVTHLDAGLPDGGELVLQDVCELALADAVPVHDDPVRLVAARALVEHHQVLFDLIRFQICNFSSFKWNLDFLKMTLTIADKSWMISCLCC